MQAYKINTVKKLRLFDNIGIIYCWKESLSYELSTKIWQEPNQLQNPQQSKHLIIKFFSSFHKIPVYNLSVMSNLLFKLFLSDYKTVLW
jgi:hypothetical protein